MKDLFLYLIVKPSNIPSKPSFSFLSYKLQNEKEQVIELEWDVLEMEYNPLATAILNSPATNTSFISKDIPKKIYENLGVVILQKDNNENGSFEHTGKNIYHIKPGTYKIQHDKQTDLLSMFKTKEHHEYF
jgi:hypothetical protein